METKSFCDTSKISKTGWWNAVCVPAITLFKCSTQSCSLGPIPKLLDNSLAPDSHSFSSLCHHLSYFSTFMSTAGQMCWLLPPRLHGPLLYCIWAVLQASSSHSHLCSAKPVLRTPSLHSGPSYNCQQMALFGASSMPLAAKMLYFSLFCFSS